MPSKKLAKAKLAKAKLAKAKLAKAMRDIYTAPNLEGAELALKDFDRQYPGAVDVWRLAWQGLIPFLNYPLELRKITKNRGRFPDEDAAQPVDQQ